VSVRLRPLTGPLNLAVAALLALVCLCALPAIAAAAEYTVDSTADEVDLLPGTGGCLTASGKCTLRAAIEESNTSAGVRDEIKFAAAFDGKLADTIALGSSLPVVTDPVTIDGDGSGLCTTETAALVKGPCVGVSGPSGGFGLQVEDDEVTIEGLAVTGALTGINVINASEDFISRNNWVGVKLDGMAGANNTGIFIDPNSNNAEIGGFTAAARNVISGNNNEGLDIEGADDALVRGNYFGVDPAGAAQLANGKDIEITDSTAGAFEATGNEIGVVQEPSGIATKACDDGCNVISGAASTGVDLNGESGGNEAPASGPTTVVGNFVGLDAAGTGVIANGTYGILVGAADGATIGADGATIGGGSYEATANFIAGGAYGIYHENGDNFKAISNQIGIGPVDAATTAPPSEVGIFVFGLTNVEPSTIKGNAVRMAGGVAIEQRFLGATIVENLISGASTGILTTGSGATGSLIAENMIGSVTGNGILIKSDANEVVDNLVLSSGAAGIKVEHAGSQPLVSPTTENVIGGELAEEENEISNSGGPAIEIVNFEETANEVGRNKGKLNGGLFIDLKATNPGTEPNGPNDGIKPPLISTLTVASASGTGAKEGAVIRVFRKASAEAGELESFLGETQADVEGKWKVEYPGSIPGGTIVAATQTSKGATSELAVATTPGGGGDKDGGGGDKGGGGGDKGKDPDVVCLSKKVKAPCPGGSDVAPPQTKILKGPKGKVGTTTVKFKFSSSEKGSTFRCKLDRKLYRVCKSPKKYKKLKPGKHVFKVRAVDKAGNIDPTAAKRKFTILR
jgi:CSLREA domain-containing protein